MAEIPVARKSKGAFPWWLIPLILILVLLGLLYYFFLRNNEAGINNTNAERSVSNTVNSNGR
jgi:hypothetical protein